ncbi:MULTISPECIES: hypothetical protein [Pseudomonas]|jgi:hypothetical protein|uniref:hypothetical protein n=1 Tax=Pseudomonas TaxID=286 RepID=UPI00054B2D79|nr:MULTISPECIES: hypothetical protein [Pseudomonas]KII32681.1 hypothetical protein NL64_11210 [Pseudomonas fluorescens]
MVKGLDTFREAFAGHAERYVLIGGVAASLALEEAGIEFRSTRDLDIVLLSRLLSADSDISLPEDIATDLRKFLAVMPSLDVDMKALGLRGVTIAEVAERIRSAFKV